MDEQYTKEQQYEQDYYESSAEYAQQGEEAYDEYGEQTDVQLEEENQAETLADLIFNAEITDQQPDDIPDNEEKATIEELASVLLYPEEIPRGSSREFAKNLYKSFRSCQTFMTLLCRLPIMSHENDDHSIVFTYSWNSCRGILFFITFGFLFLITLCSTLNIVSTMLNFPNQPETLNGTWDFKVSQIRDGEVTWDSDFLGIMPKVNRTFSWSKDRKLLRAEEMFIFRRNLVPILLVMFLLYHILMADWNLISRRHFVASYLTFWTESVEIMKIDAAGDARKFIKKFLLYYVIWFIIFMASLGINLAPIASGVPVSFTLLWFRAFWPSMYTIHDSYISILRGIGGFTYLYIVLASKVYVLFFLYICKILSTACTVWNERLEKIFTLEERSKQRKEKCASRTGFDHLFKDYVTLLDLMSGADALFTNIIESYFSMTIISIVFEVYNLVRPVQETQFEYKNARTFDMLPIGVYLFNTIMIVYLVSSGAAEVGESAANGLEIIRRQGIMGHRPDSEMHFMISLYMSYTGHFDTALSGGGYFLLDKAFFVAVAGTMISYIIIIFQFQPALGLANAQQRTLIGDPADPGRVKELVMHIENTFKWVANRQPGL